MTTKDPVDWEKLEALAKEAEELHGNDAQSALRLLLRQLNRDPASIVDRALTDDQKRRLREAASLTKK